MAPSSFGEPRSMKVENNTSSVQMVQFFEKSRGTVAQKYSGQQSSNHHESDDVHLDISEKAKKIMHNYNLHDISMDEVRALGKALREVGVLNDQQYMDFTTPWFGSINIQTGEIITNDTKMDYLAAFQRTISFLKETDPTDTLTISHMENTQAMFLNLDELSETELEAA